MKLPYGVCHLCEKPTNSLAGNPSDWPIELPFFGGNGQQRVYHIHCVALAIHAAEEAKHGIFTVFTGRQAAQKEETP